MLSVSKASNQAAVVPLNNLHDKDDEKIKIVFIGEYIYADHSYLQIPEYYALPSSDNPAFPVAKIGEEFTEIIVPVIKKENGLG